MLSERIISGVMRRGNDKYLRFSSMDKPELPPPHPGREYLLYVHVPFCERLCPYCSFNRFPYDESAADAYFERLRVEMRQVADLGYDFGSMYVGGGTPTIDIDELVKTIDLAKELFSIKEVSSETNPNHLYPQWIDPLRRPSGPLQRGSAVARRRAAAADGPLRQVRLGVPDPRAARGDRGRVPLA